jgi:transcriptional regulator with XRE-family HTH domain
MDAIDPFEGLGRALAILRERAGFPTQTQASETLKIDKGQLSRWENENPRPNLENLGRALAGYGASVLDLGAVLRDEVPPGPRIENLAPADADLIRSLAAAIRRVEGVVDETVSRVDQLEKDKDLSRAG